MQWSLGGTFDLKMAEGEGFEPPEALPPQRFSRPPQSTALPSLLATRKSYTDEVKGNTRAQRWPKALAEMGNAGPGSATLFDSVDAASGAVTDPDAGLAFYGDALGHSLLWRDDDIGQAGTELPGSAIEHVLSTR